MAASAATRDRNLLRKLQVKSKSYRHKDELTSAYPKSNVNAAYAPTTRKRPTQRAMGSPVVAYHAFDIELSRPMFE